MHHLHAYHRLLRQYLTCILQMMEVHRSQGPQGESGRPRIPTRAVQFGVQTQGLQGTSCLLLEVKELNSLARISRTRPTSSKIKKDFPSPFPSEPPRTPTPIRTHASFLNPQAARCTFYVHCLVREHST